MAECICMINVLILFVICSVLNMTFCHCSSISLWSTLEYISSSQFCFSWSRLWRLHGYITGQFHWEYTLYYSNFRTLYDTVFTNDKPFFNSDFPLFPHRSLYLKRSRDVSCYATLREPSNLSYLSDRSQCVVLDSAFKGTSWIHPGASVICDLC